jgi:hypothetical protein
LGEPIDYAARWTIGDKPTDVGFGVALGTRTALLRSTYWSDGELEIPPDLIVRGFYEAARFLLLGQLT